MSPATAIALISAAEFVLKTAPRVAASLGLTRETLDETRTALLTSQARLQQIADELGIDADFLGAAVTQTPYANPDAQAPTPGAPDATNAPDAETHPLGHV